MILIRVCDEARQLNKSFTCQRDLLMKEMRYFTSYLNAQSHSQDVDISVHCDINIFEWLMKFIHNKNDPPELGNGFFFNIFVSKSNFNFFFCV